MDTPHNLLPYGGEAYFLPKFFGEDEVDAYFAELRTSVDWQQEEIWMFGRKVMQPRLTALYGDPTIPYGYSGIRMRPHPFTPLLEKMRERVSTFAGIAFTHVLLNYYRDGQDSMGWHRDNEVSLGPEPVIASISLGAARRFQFRHYERKTEKIDLVLNSGSLLLMRGLSQRFWEHQLPKVRKISAPRINLTFRVVYSLTT